MLWESPTAPENDPYLKETRPLKGQTEFPIIISSSMFAVGNTLKVHPVVSISCPRWSCLELSQGVPAVPYPNWGRRRHQLLPEENITCFMKKASEISILTFSENPTKVPNICHSKILFHHTRAPVKLEISCTYSLSSLPHFEPGQDTLLLEDALTPTFTQTQTGTVQTH